jgi:hypothetical protein
MYHHRTVVFFAEAQKVKVVADHTQILDVVLYIVPSALRVAHSIATLRELALLNPWGLVCLLIAHRFTCRIPSLAGAPASLQPIPQYHTLW